MQNIHLHCDITCQSNFLGSTMTSFLFFPSLFLYVTHCGAILCICFIFSIVNILVDNAACNSTLNIEKSVMRALESSSYHVNTSLPPSSSLGTNLERARPWPPGSGRKWEEEEEEEKREVAGSQRETEWGEIGRGTPSKIKRNGSALLWPKQAHQCCAFSESCCL